MDDDRTPILVGCGQVTQREPDTRVALAALDLTAQAARIAADDAHAGQRLIDALDTIVVLRSFSDTSWRFKSPFGGSKNPPRSVASRINASSAKQLVYTYPGGNMPQWCVNRLFEKITAGEVGAALIAGGEALATQKAAQRAQIELDWNEDPGGAPENWGVSTQGWNEVEERHRMSGAIFAYPLFENSIRGSRGRTIEAHRLAMGRLFERFAAVAAGNPLADRRQGFSAEQISTLSAENPYIGFPYTKRMNSNAFIDQAAAIILTSVSKARELGIPQSKWVYLHGCADAHDHWYISDRINHYTSPAMRMVAAETMAMADCSLTDIGAFDLYSCFPSAVEIGCKEMGLAEDDPRGLTVTGGLPYFGGPGNNYVTHSIVEMMNRVRANPGMNGMVTANGNYVTKQSAGIYSTAPPERRFAPKPPKTYQARIDGAKGPPVVEIASGAAKVETYTVMHDRAGPSYAILFGRDAQGRRFIANTPDDANLLRDMTTVEFLGASGVVQTNENGVNIFKPD